MQSHKLPWPRRRFDALNGMEMATRHRSHTIPQWLHRLRCVHPGPAHEAHAYFATNASDVCSDWCACIGAQTLQAKGLIVLSAPAFVIKVQLRSLGLNKRRPFSAEPPTNPDLQPCSRQSFTVGPVTQWRPLKDPFGVVNSSGKIDSRTIRPAGPTPRHTPFLIAEW